MNKTSEFFKNSEVCFHSFIHTLQIIPKIIRQVTCLDIFHHQLPVFFRRAKILRDKFTVDQLPISHAHPFEIVRELPIFGQRNQPVFDRIGMDINAQVEQVGIRGDRLALELTLEQRAHPGETLVDGFGVGNTQTHHCLGNYGRDLGVLGELRGLFSYPPQNMIMRGHQTIRQNIHLLAQILPHPMQEIQIIIALEEHGLAVIAAIVEVIILVGKERECSARHVGSARLPKF